MAVVRDRWLLYTESYKENVLHVECAIVTMGFWGGGLNWYSHQFTGNIENWELDGMRFDDLPDP